MVRKHQEQRVHWMELITNWMLQKKRLVNLKDLTIETGVHIGVQQKRIQLGTMRLPFPSLASLSGLRIWRCQELWYSSQMQLGSGVAVALAQAGSYSSN